MIITFLTVSVLLNIFFIWYLRRMIKDYFYTLEGLESMVDDMSQFSNHLERVNSLDTFYGDTTLQNLIKHSKDLVIRLKEYESIMSIDNTNEEQDGEKEEE